MEIEARRFVRGDSPALLARSGDARPLAPDAADAAKRGIATTGVPLNASVRRPLELRLGIDLGEVRVHADAEADRAARAVGAQAFAIGTDIVFASGRYRPYAADGQQVLAHELAHVAQQAATGERVLARFGALDVVDIVSPGTGAVLRASGISGSSVLEGVGRAVLGETLWTLLSEFLGGLQEGLERAPAAQVQRLQQRIDRFGLTDAYEYTRGYLWGVLLGLWHAISGLVEAVITLLALPYRLLQWLTQTLPQLAVRYGPRLGAFLAGGGLRQRLSRIFDAFRRDPAGSIAQVRALLETARGAVLQWVRQRGRQAAADLLSFLEQPWRAIGERFGDIAGQVLFEVLLAVGTDLIGNLLEKVGELGAKLVRPIITGVREAMTVLRRVVGQLFEWIGGAIARFAGDTAELLQSIRRFLAEFMGVFDELGPELETAGGPPMRAPTPPAPPARATVAEMRATPPRGPTPTAAPAPRPGPTPGPRPAPSSVPGSAATPAAPEVVEPGGRGVRFELTERRAERLQRVAEAVRDDTKWGNVSPRDRLRLGRVYDELLETLVRHSMSGVQTVEHYVALDARLIARLQSGGGRVLVTEGRLARDVGRFDMLEINFERRTAELVDLTSRPRQVHADKLLRYRRELSRLLPGFRIEAKELYYTGEHGELLEDLVEVLVR